MRLLVSRVGRILFFNQDRISKQRCERMSEHGAVQACVGWGVRALGRPGSKLSQCPGDTHLVSSTGSSHDNICLAEAEAWASMLASCCVLHRWDHGFQGEATCAPPDLHGGGAFLTLFSCRRLSSLSGIFSHCLVGYCLTLMEYFQNRVQAHRAEGMGWKNSSLCCLSARYLVSEKGPS